MLIDFLISLLQDFRNANVLTKTTAISALAFFVVAPAGVIAAWYRRGVTRLQEENAELKRECRERRRAEEQLRRDVQGLRPQTIAGLVERVAFERRDGNHEQAIRLLRGFIDHDAAALGPHCRAIAEWHLSMVEGDPPSEHWTAAKRFATLAVHLEPNERTAAALLAEINARTGDAALRAGDIETTRRDWEEAWHWAPDLADDNTLVDVLLERLPKLREEGDYFRFLALAQRAVAVCRRTFGTRHEATFVAWNHHAAALKRCGRATEALEAIDALLPIQIEVSGYRHPETLRTRLIRASVLEDLGRYQEALKAVDAVLPIEMEVLGERHPEVLTTGNLRASILHYLGRHDEALDAVDALLPIEMEVLGERHPEVLTTRYIRASIIRDLGRYEEALQALCAVLPIETEVRGDRHPKTLTTRWLRASVLHRLARDDEALAAIDAFLPIRAEVSGERHPETLLTRLLRASVLHDLGRNDEALEAVDALLPIEMEVLGEPHPDTLATHRLRGSILREIGEVDEALTAHRAAHEGLAQLLGDRHPRTLYTATELGLSLAASGDTPAAEALLVATLAVQSEVLGGEHPDTRRTMEALDNLRAQGSKASASIDEEEPAPQATES